LLLVFAGPASLIASAQSAATPKSKDPELSDAYVLYQNERGETVCREATLAERRDILDRRRAELRTIYSGAPRRGAFPGGDEKLTANSTTTSDQPAMNLLPSAGLRIVLHGTAQLDLPENQAARQAFIVAANRWESLISTPITVVIDVDYGTKVFGSDKAFPANVLGSTGSFFQASNIFNVHNALNQSVTNAEEAALYNALPSASVPIEFGGTTSSVTNVLMTYANARALGLRSNITDTAPGDAGIGFNSAFGFDFTPDDGIDSDKTDFDAVAVHEIGHALGFSSSSGGPNTPTSLSMWDVFRFRPGTGSLATMATAPRVMSLGGEQVFFSNHTSTHAATLNATELGLSTGGPNGDSVTGDGRQSSHWKDDFLVVGRPFIGIMDPNIGKGQRKEIGANDIKALDTFGYSIGGALPQPPSAPANDNFVNAVELQGPSGSVTGTNVAATKEPGEPNHAGDPGGGTVWYRWTATGTGQATFNTEGSNYDTMLGVYTGTSVGGLSLITANDDVQNGVIRTSIVNFNVTAGTTYRIVVDGWNGETGQIKLNWTAPGQAVHSISGRIQSACCEQSTGTTGITMTLGGSQSGTTQTDAGGFYSFPNLAAGGNYTITPSKTGATFTPASATFNNLTQNQTADFTAARLTFLISGQAKDAQGNAIAGATVVLAKIVPDSPIGIPTFRDTDSAGNFSFVGDPGATYALSISKPGFVFLEPRSVTFNNLSANQSVTFNARRFILSGRVTDGSGNAIGGATVSLTGPRTAATTTDAEGGYSFGDLPAGTYTLSPSKTGQFTAFAQNVVLSGDQTGVELRLTPFINITGRVVDGAGNPLTGATIGVSNQFFTHPVNGDGSYSINISPTASAPVTLLAEKFGYQFAPPSVNFTGVSGGNQVVNFTGTLGNKIDGSQFFAAQHYLDFLGREADAGGLAFWTNGIESCGPSVQCVVNKRIDTSAAFFLSIEFQETGFLVQRMYKTAYGDAVGQATIGGVLTNIAVPMVRLNEFLPDTQRIGLNVIVGSPGWPERLEANKTAFAQEFVSRSRFAAAFASTLTPTEFVNILNTNAGNVLSPSERDALVAELTANNTVAGRASVLRKVAEDADLAAAETNKAFVLMQFFGYLRRNPNDAPDTNHSGYNFWLKKLNDNGGDFRRAQMVQAFLDSIEYRNRFVP